MHRHPLDSQRERPEKTAKQRNDILSDRQTDGRQMGRQDNKAKSQRQRKTDGKLTVRQTGGLGNKWDAASQTNLEA